jgi:hypothetical protein
MDSNGGATGIEPVTPLDVNEIIENQMIEFIGFSKTFVDVLPGLFTACVTVRGRRCFLFFRRNDAPRVARHKFCFIFPRLRTNGAGLGPMRVP